jgi:hypothetical protein
VFTVFLNGVNVVPSSVKHVLSLLGMPVVYLWAALTYNGKETKRIAKFFKESPIKIAFRTQYNA